jgi:phosphotransferase system HPr (HPr) family protein
VLCLSALSEHKPDDLCMNSIRYRIVNPWGVHARSAAFITSVANVCAKDWEVVATVRGQEADAKSIMSLMMLAASYQSEIEFFSLMPDENWPIYGLTRVAVLRDRTCRKQSPCL